LHLSGVARTPYPTDRTDDQWERLQPLLPSPKPGTPSGGRPAADTREVVNAVLYLLRSGGSWRLLPRDFPGWKTVYTRFRLWRPAGIWDRPHAALRADVRIEAGYPPTPRPCGSIARP
jgi:putative transposase